MKATIELSEKALELVRSRRGSLTIEQYVNLVLENLYAESSQSIVRLDGFNLFDALEAGMGDSTEAEALRNASLEEKRMEAFYRSLKKDYPDKVPGSVFYARGLALGLSRNCVENAEKIYDHVASMSDPNVKMYVSSKAREIMGYLKESYSQVPLPVFLDKCRLAGLLKEEISIAIRQYKGELKTVEIGDEYSAFMIADMVYDYLTELYGNRVPEQVFYGKCAERGISPDRVRLLMQKYRESFTGVVDTDSGR